MKLQEYDLQINAPGVYQIRNLSDGKVYVGSGVDIRCRQWQHFTALMKGIHPNILLQRVWNRYGGDNFEFEIIEHVEFIEEKYTFKKKLLEREQYFMDIKKSADRKYGYNICKIAGSTLGIRFNLPNKRKSSKCSDETKKKISDGRKGINNWNFGKLSRNAKSIVQCDLDGKELRKWDSIYLALCEFGFEHKSRVIRCCKGKLESAFGFKWRYQDPKHSVCNSPSHMGNCSLCGKEMRYHYEYGKSMACQECKEKPEQLMRKCPECGKTLRYSNFGNCVQAERKNKRCLSCSKRNKK